MLSMCCCVLLVANAPLKADDPDLSGYRTAQEARTREIAPNRGGVGGETGYLGLSVARDDKGRIVVEDVSAGSPADKAGLRKGDVLASLGDEAVKSPEWLRDRLQARGPGESVKLAAKRGDETVACTATLAATSRPRTLGARRAYLGVMLAEDQPGDGVLVDRVTADSPAAASGFKAGDLIFKVEGADVTSSTRFLDILNEKKLGDELEVAVRRGDSDVVLRPRLSSDTGGGGQAGRGGGQNPAANTIELWKKPVFRLAVVRIEFPDVRHNDKLSTSDWRDALLSEGVYRDKENAAGAKVHGSLNDYFREQSGGAFKLDGRVFDWVEVGKKRSEYVLGSGTTNITAVLTEALAKIADRDGKESFKDFDGFLFLYAGSQAPGNRGGVYYPHAGTIRSFQSRRWPYMIAAEGGTRPTPIGGVVKEFGLMLGLPDLAARPEDRGSEGLGVWCAMSNPAKTDRPQSLSPWVKEKLGWLQPIAIDPTVKQKLILAPIEDSPKECIKVLVRADGSEYFLLENRKKTGFDGDQPGEGLLIWRVAHDRPTLEESHGIEGPSGPTVQLEAVPFPSTANHAFTPETTPSSRSPLGGGLPVSITSIRRLPDGRITFQIGYEYR